MFGPWSEVTKELSPLGANEVLASGAPWSRDLKGSSKEKTKSTAALQKKQQFYCYKTDFFDNQTCLCEPGFVLTKSRTILRLSKT